MAKRREYISLILTSSVSVPLAGCMGDNNDTPNDQIKTMNSATSHLQIDNDRFVDSDSGGTISDTTYGGAIRVEMKDSPSTGVRFTKGVIVNNKNKTIVKPAFDSFSDFRDRYSSQSSLLTSSPPYTINIEEDDDYIIFAGSYIQGDRLDNAEPAERARIEVTDSSRSSDEDLGEYPVEDIPTLIEEVFTRDMFFHTRDRPTSSEIDNISDLMALISVLDYYGEDNEQLEDYFGRILAKYGTETFHRYLNERLSDELGKISDLIVQIINVKYQVPIQEDVEEVIKDRIESSARSSVDIHVPFDRAEYTGSGQTKIDFRFDIEIEIGAIYLEAEEIVVESPYFTVNYEQKMSDHSGYSEYRDYFEINGHSTIISLLSNEIPNKIESFSVKANY